MPFEDFTPFIPATFVTAKDGRGYVATVLVKATLAMRHDAFAEPLDDQLFPQGDVYTDDAQPAESSLHYASDFTPTKPRGEVVLVGAAHRPADRPEGDFTAALHVGALSKELVVSGRREFEHGVFSSKIIEQEPLAAVPLTFENAFGGPKTASNPVGRGDGSNELPLVEHPSRRLGRPGDKPEPSSFAPIAPSWEPRKSMIGTYRHDYAAKHWPGFPTDFNPAYFNAAPIDQQIDGYWRGDEEIILENIHSDHAHFRTKLPGWRVVCVREDFRDAAELIPLAIDTLQIDADAGNVVVLWRGETKIQSPDAPEIKHFGFLVQSLAAEIRDVAYYQRQLQEFIDQRDAEYEPKSPPEPSPAIGVETNPGTAAPSAAESAEPDPLLAQLQGEIAAVRSKAGHPEESPPPQSVELPPLAPEAR
ncbi:MAG: DUF2169 domain-containing protein, partial [Planctomycetota bacterium]